MNKPLVSISIITYNQINYIHQTLDSALGQNYDNLEIVVADDASSDGTDEIIMDYARRNPDRVKPVLGEVNLGVTRNSNKALQACKGKYVAFQGGDDILLPRKIENQVAWMEEDAERVLCGHDVELFESNNGKLISRWSDMKPMRSGRGAGLVVKYGVPYAATSIMVRASSLPPYGFDERLPLVSDWKLWIDCLAGGGTFGYIEGSFARYRISENNVSRAVNAINRDRLVTLALVETTYPELLTPSGFQRGYVYYDLGIALMKEKRYTEARKSFLASLRSAFVTYKVLIAFLLCLLPKNWSLSLLKDRSVPRGFSDYLKKSL